MSSLPSQADASIERRVEAEQVRTVLARARPSNLLALPISFLIAWMLHGKVPDAWLLLWLVAKLGVWAWRVAASRGLEQDDDEAVMRRGRKAQYALCADGLVFGLLGTVLLPRSDPAYLAITLATVSGIASVGQMVLSSHQRHMLAFTLPLLVPTTLGQFLAGTELSIYVGLAMAAFLLLLLTEGRNSSTFARTMLSLRYQMDDLARQRQQALALAETNSRLKDRFLATVSHELRTPLHGLLGAARLVQAEVKAESRSSAWLQIMERTGEHLLGVINDVLDLSRIRDGHLKLVTEAFDLESVLGPVADVARLAAEEKGLAWASTRGTGVPRWVKGDAARLRQILLNLTGNAVKFTDRGAVELAVRADADGTLVLSVIDTGKGVPEELREAIFEAFRQADDSDGRRHGGAGLGLTISRDLARAMGGDLRCLPNGGAGSGAIFELRLPLPAVAEPSLPEPSPLLPQLAGRVLLVEDNPVNAMVAQAVLARMGLEVELLDGGRAAVDRAARGGLDLILMDCQMPGVDGYEATRCIRDAERSAGQTPVPIVALTANTSEADRQRSRDAGMDGHIIKPFRPDELAAALVRWL